MKKARGNDTKKQVFFVSRNDFSGAIEKAEGKAQYKGKKNTEFYHGEKLNPSLF